MEYVFAFIIGIALLVAWVALMLWKDIKDQEYRERNDLPPKKYHGISKYDVTTVYTVVHKTGKKD